MQEEMQAEAVADVTENEQPAVEQASESSADSGENHEQKVTFSDEQQAVFNKKIGEQTFKRRESERQAETREADLNRQLTEARALLPKEQRPDVPVVPDRYDFDDDTKFAAAITARDQAVRDSERFDARRTFQAEQQQHLEQQQANVRQEAFNETVKGYAGRAVQLGVSPEELQQAANAVAAFGVNDSVVSAILADEHGPLITKYLAANPAILDTFSKLDPVSAGVQLVAIKAEASKLIAARPTVPDPVDTITGQGGRPKQKGGNHTYE